MRIWKIKTKKVRKENFKTKIMIKKKKTVRISKCKMKNQKLRKKATLKKMFFQRKLMKMKWMRNVLKKKKRKFKKQGKLTSKLMGEPILMMKILFKMRKMLQNRKTKGDPKHKVDQKATKEPETQFILFQLSCWRKL